MSDYSTQLHKCTFLHGQNLVDFPPLICRVSSYWNRSCLFTWWSPFCCLRFVVRLHVSLCPSGWIPSFYRGAAAAGSCLRLHVVQPSGQETKVFQKTWEKNVDRGRERGERWTAGRKGGGECRSCSLIHTSAFTLHTPNHSSLKCWQNFVKTWKQCECLHPIITCYDVFNIS